jgi:hypothetical protein
MERASAPAAAHLGCHPEARHKTSNFTLGSFTTAAAETTDGRRDGGHGDRVPGAVTVIAKLQVLILPNANTL